MNKKTHNLSSSPSNKNTSFLMRGVIFVIKLIKNMFINFFEGIFKILLFPFKAPMYFYYGIKGILYFFFVFIPKKIKDKKAKLDIIASKKITDPKKLAKLKKQEEKFQKKLLEKKKLAEAKNAIRLKKQKEKDIKFEARRKKEEAKIIKLAEIKRAKERKLIAKLEKEAKIKQAIKENYLRKKETENKLREAKLAERKKKKEESQVPLKEKINKWYTNLSFVRYRENKAEMQRQVLLDDIEGDDSYRSNQKIYYKFIAKKIETGDVETGTLSAFSKLDVHSYLLAEGYEVLEITPQRNYGQGLLMSLFKGKLKTADLVFFLTQLSTFLKSGLPLLESIKILEKQTNKKKYKSLYKSVSYELTMGENFSDALEKQGDSFPKLLINMVRSAELSGNLSEILDDMAVYYDEMEKTKKQMKSAMMYPLVIFVFASIVVVFIMIYVIPEFVGIYEEMDADLPAITEITIKLSSFLQKNILYLVLGIIAFVIILKSSYKSIKVFRTMIQWLSMHIPVFGNIIIYNEVTMFTKTFGSLLNHNVFITDSMEVLSRITSNEIYKMLIFDTITNLAKGSSISNAFKDQWAFPVIAYEMILTGEKTGELGNMMVKVSNYYQLQHKNSVNQIKTFIEPLMIVFLTVIVGIILMSVVLPMFNMYSEVL